MECPFYRKSFNRMPILEKIISWNAHFRENHFIKNIFHRGKCRVRVFYEMGIP
jgi:hypothetical protein